MKNNEKYKALILDLDGTSIPNRPDAMPTSKVTEAIKRARAKIYVGIATSRPYYAATHIIEHFGLSGPCIVNSGAQIIDARSRTVLREQAINGDDLEFICKEAKRLNLPLFLNTMTGEVKCKDRFDMDEKILGAAIYPEVGEKDADLIIDAISHLPTIAVSKIPGIEKRKFYVGISHASATKQHGIYEVAKILNIETNEIIGVGDGDNDFPLLMACGLRVAMGNAVEGLKDLADYIAPTVFEDGVVDVINRFVLN